MIGAGKYDDVLTAAREAAGATGAILIVFEGARGFGFSCQADLLTTVKIPQILRTVADSIEADLKQGKL